MKITALNRPAFVIDWRGEAPYVPAKLDDTPPMTKSEEDALWDEFRRSYQADTEELAEKMRAEGFEVLAFAPDHVQPLQWMDEIVSPLFTAPRGQDDLARYRKPKHARSIVLHLALPNGEPRDQVTVRIETSASVYKRDDGDDWFEHIGKVSLTVSTAAGFCVGTVRFITGEYCSAVIGLRNASPELVARAVRALSAPDIMEWPASLYAALARRSRCHCCERPLADAVSRAIGVGPDCARMLGLEHSQRMADAVLKRCAAMPGTPTTTASNEGTQQ